MLCVLQTYNLCNVRESGREVRAVVGQSHTQASSRLHHLLPLAFFFLWKQDAERRSLTKDLERSDRIAKELDGAYDNLGYKFI